MTRDKSLCLQIPHLVGLSDAEISVVTIIHPIPVHLKAPTQAVPILHPASTLSGPQKLFVILSYREGEPPGRWKTRFPTFGDYVFQVSQDREVRIET